MKKTSLRGRLAVFLMALLPFAALAQSIDEAAFQAASSKFDSALKGDKEQVEAAIAAFQALQQKDPRQPLYAVYLGSATALKAREAWLPWNKMKYSEQGLDYIDQGLAALKPEHDKQLARGVAVSAIARLTAAGTFLALPDSIFHRRNQGVGLIAALQASPLLATAPEPFRAAFAAQAARAKEATK